MYHGALFSFEKKSKTMTYNEARKQNIGDMVQPKCKPGNVRITDICQAGKRILFTCDDHATYCHKNVNPPILRILQHGKTIYRYDPNTRKKTYADETCTRP